MKKSGHTPTIRDVANRARVSTATVSHVVNDTGRSGAKTRERVEAAIAALGYRPNGNAASLRRRRSRLVGLVIPTLTNAFFARMASEFEKLATAAGYDIVTTTAEDDPAREHERIQALLSRQIDALIIYPARDETVGLGIARTQLPPVVLVDRAAGLAGFDTVGLANEQSGYDAARYLIDNGHLDIAVLLDAPAQGAMQDRLKGVRRAMAQAGAAARCRVVSGGLAIEDCRSAVEQELRRQDRATAIIAASNVATLGAIKALQGLQLEIPRDVSLVGYDDFDWMTALRPYVTAVAQPFERLAASAWTLLMDQISARDGTAVKSQPQHVSIAGELRIRESTGRAALMQ